jgi:hypothetical protein
MWPLSFIMKILVKGSFRKKVTSGAFIFKSEKWVETPFSWECVAETATCEATEPVPDLDLSIDALDDRYFINAVVRTRPYVIGEITQGQPRAFPFTILSIKDVEVRGRLIALTGDPDLDGNVIAEFNAAPEPEPRKRRTRRSKR